MNVFVQEVNQTIMHIRSKYKRDGVEFVDLANGQSYPIESIDLKQIFAFSIGGGSFQEYESFKNELDVAVVYGCDHIYRPIDFMQEILNLN